MPRTLCCLFGLLVAGGCGGSGTSPSSPPPAAPAPPATPPPDPTPPPNAHVVAGFARDRIEIREGETIHLEVPFDAVADLRFFVYDAVTIRVGVEILEDDASADDLLVAREIAVYGNGRGRTPPVSDVALVTIRAREDGLAEPPERLRLRLKPASVSPWYLAEPLNVGLTRPEIEVVILDGANECSDIRISAAAPRRVDSGTACERGIHETEITVETGEPQTGEHQPLQMGSSAVSRVLARRTEPAGAGFRHSLTVQWRLGPGPEQEFRFQPCLDPGRGPTLICSNRACGVFAEGEEVPPPQPPVCGRALGE